MVIELNGLTKFYGVIRALDGVSLRLDAGAVGLLGPNGAGKSTLIKCLLGLVRVSMGEGKVLGLDIRAQSREIRQRIGYMPEDDCYFIGLTAVESVAYAGELAGMKRREALRRAHEILDWVGVAEERYRELQTFSTGMKQKAKLAQALIHDPEVVLLDEPTNGLDPEGRERMLRLIKNLAAKRNITVLLSTHLLHDVEVVCSRVVIMAQGKIKRAEELEKLRHTATESYTVDLHAESAAFAEALRARGCSVSAVTSTQLRVGGAENIPQLSFAAADRTQARIRRLQRTRSSLESIYLDVIAEAPPKL